MRTQCTSRRGRLGLHHPEADAFPRRIGDRRRRMFALRGRHRRRQVVGVEPHGHRRRLKRRHHAGRLSGYVPSDPHRADRPRATFRSAAPTRLPHSPQTPTTLLRG